MTCGACDTCPMCGYCKTSEPHSIECDGLPEPDCKYAIPGGCSSSRCTCNRVPCAYGCCNPGEEPNAPSHPQDQDRPDT